MSQTPDRDELVTELTDRAYTAVAYILRQLAQSYLTKIGDTLVVNDTLLRTMSQMVGEMIACYPEEEQESIYEAVTKTVTYSQEMMALELADLEKDSEDSDDEEPASEEGFDLARMTPRGNC